MRKGFGLLLSSFLVLSACGGGGDETGDGGAGDNGWLSLLAAVPDTPGNRTQVIGNDYAAARALIGIEAPPSDASEEAIRDYVITISLGPSIDDPEGGLASHAPMLDLPAGAAFGDRVAASPLEWKTEFGFTIVDLDRDLAAGVPPGETYVYEGNLDPEAIEATLRADPIWGPDLEVLDHAGETYFAWGEDFEVDPDRRSAARPLGRGGRLAVRDGVVIRTYGSEVMEQALDVRDSTAGTLAGIPQAADLAAALDASGVYSALFMFDVSSFSLAVNPLEVVTGQADPSGGEWLGPYLALATGPGLDGDQQPIAVFALAHTSAEAAAENAARMERMLAGGVSVVTNRPWTEHIDGYEVAVDGTTVVATLWTEGPPRLWVQIPWMRDSLVRWEP